MKIYNSLTRTKEEFVSLKKGKIGMYICGPTVYDEPHIGHARSAYIFDCIRRYFEYRGYEVTFVRNVTDVDDKIIDKARSAFSHQLSVISLEEAAGQISRQYLASYHEDMALLGIGGPDKEPKATEYISKMVKFIGLLIERGRAYEANGDVYFNIRKAKDYGKLSNQNLDKMEAGARGSSGEDKKDPLDFALWKKAKDTEPSWNSPWGMGRPGWHIECSAMSSDILGDEFDVHGGGVDLIFPHHENEIAQSEGAGKAFARYWIHNGLLTINNEKMAKSLGNFVSIKDFISKYKDADYLKLLFLNTHYRHPVDYTEEKIQEMMSQKERFLILFDKLDKIKEPEPRFKIKKVTTASTNSTTRFEEAMDDDFNTPMALAVLFDLVTYANIYMQGKTSFTEYEVNELIVIKRVLTKLASVFGLNLSKLISKEEIDENDILKLIEERDEARRSKDFKKSDLIRDRLVMKGIILEDTKDGTTWRRKP
ncbi:MAG: cysteine--tRNA ligase [Omnitrophica bacterium RIFCSPLOWO2_02_FULL_45_16]|nr:MAG: cysteine--tRNA ligase [Omnitrophica bacterium RIFCSPHIGHO2_02_FULL_46_20]OGX00738.1 MAG: cysteine--tRNA ligase [Omnitrophica bacterium RIFCSPLOWO2_02_FULL_45_16]